MSLLGHEEQPLSASQLKNESLISNMPCSKTEQWIALSLCAAVLAAGTLEHIIRSEPTYASIFAPDWIAFAAAVFAGAGVIQWSPIRLFRLRRALLWIGLLLMVWTANGLPFDLLRMTPLMPFSVDWSGMATRTLAFASIVVLARIALTRPANAPSKQAASWYGYAAFLLALPYPVLRTCWALGGMIGLSIPGAGGVGFIPWLACIPWLMAAILSLLLVSKSSRLPRRFLLVAGWTATAIVAMIGPAACWAMISALISGNVQGIKGMAFWVPCLFYSSWFLWAIAAGAATRSYQLRSANSD